MKTLKSYVCGAWHEADGDFRPLTNPATGEEIARASSKGVDFAAALGHARTVGGPALRAMTFLERGGLLRSMSRVLRDHRDELLELSRVNTGTTAADGAFDVDGGSGTLAYYGSLSRTLGETRVLAEGEDGAQLGKTEAFYGRHVLVPRRGVAVHVNAFNFPVWGFAEKAACALLAGMPVITKPATATALVAERAVELILEADILPDGALQLVCGGTGDLLDLLGPQDVFAFTGSADTGLKLRSKGNLLEENTTVNLEADSLNAAVLASGEVAPETFQLFVKDVVREMTQKTGQKCTAVRRILVPAERMDEVQAALIERLGRTVTGNPAEGSVTMGPLATEDQLRDAVEGVAALTGEGGVEIVHGTGERVDGEGAEAGQGYYFAPTLLRAADARQAGPVHRREVFGPVATLLPYDGSAEEAAEIVALGGGTLVTSVYGDDRDWLAELLGRAGATTGRVYLGTAASSQGAFGSGVALPQSLHGGPGRAGGGEELGGLVGVKRYLQRVALQGDKETVDALAGC